MHVVKSFPLTLLCVVVIWILCLMPIPETRLSEVPFIDKWVHIALYTGLTGIFWTECLWHKVQLPLAARLFWGVVAPVLMSGLLELLQAYATTCRSGDWFDFLANGLGVVVGGLYGRVLSRHFS